MAEKTLNTRQKQKYDASTNWTTNNPVLLAGELGIESDTNKFKIGNGTSAWNELDYVGNGEVMLYSTTGQNTDGAMTQKATTDALPQCIEIEMNMQTGQASITVEQFEKLLENQENYIVVNMSLTDSDGSTRTESVKFIRGSYRKEETPSYWVEKLFFNSVNTGDTEKNPYMYLILARHSISPNDIGIGMGGEEYATVNQLNNKVDKVTNMGLSTNDYTTADKNKLAGIEAGAEVNPTSLSELSEDATHRLVTDTEKSTWNAKSDFSGSYNDLTNKPTIPTDNAQLTNGAGYTKVTVNDVAQTNLDFDSDPQTQIDNIANNTTKIANSFGGFVAGEGASASIANMPSMNDGGVAIGKGAQVVSGGGAIGDSAYCYENGFAGGKFAKATNNCIQLGWGTNDEPQSLQIYNDNIYNANTHKLGLALTNAIFPVGAIYMSTNNTSPASLFGGSWIRLPENYTLWTASSGAGSTIAAGLPNITGTFGTASYKDFRLYSGAFGDGGTHRDSRSTSDDRERCVYKFDASKSNTIYGKSTTVQPPAYKVYAWRRAE